MKDETSLIILATILFLEFSILKFMGYLDWSWFLVFAPIWVPFALSAVIFFILHYFCGRSVDR